MTYGYARVSTTDQNLDLQTDALKEFGCDKIVTEKHTSGKTCPELEKLLQILHPGDTLAVWKLDRLGRSIHHLVNMIEKFNQKSIEFISLQEKINTKNAQGRFFFHLIASLAEFEREMIRERTIAGLTSARARGRKGGRPKGLNIEAQLKALQARKMHTSGKYTISQITTKLGISKPTLYNYLRTEISIFN